MSDILNNNNDVEFFSCSSSDDFRSACSSNSLDGIETLDTELNRIFVKSSLCINLVHINAQSIPAHFSDFLTSFSNVHVDGILVSESWLKPSLPSSLYSLPGFNLIRNDRTGKGGGGVCIYLRDNLTFKILRQSPNLYSGNLEYLFLEISTHYSKLLLGVAYSPSLNINYFNTFESILDDLSPSYDHIIVMGDLNTCLIKNNSRSEKLKSLVSSFNLSLLPLSATHFSPISDPSLLDVIIVAKTGNVVTHGQLDAPFSYHDLLFLRYNFSIPRRKGKTVLRRNLKHINIHALHEDVSTIDWSPLYSASTVDDKVGYLNSTLTNVFDSHAPARPVRVKHLPAPWLTPEIKTLMVKRNKAKKLCKKNPTEDNFAVYKRLRNRCNKMCRDAKRRHIHSSIKHFTRAQTWSFLKSLGVGKSPQVLCQSIDINSLNTHFSSPPVRIADSKKKSLLLKLYEDAPPNCDPFIFNQISEEDVKRSILSISSKAVGYDGISREMILLIIDFLVPIITHILNFSLVSNTFPTVWKMANVIPLPKTSNPTSFSQFRPISILPFLSKVLENAIFKQLTSYLSHNNLLSPFQSGFRPSHSTSTALLKVTDDIRLAMDNKELTVLVLLDFSSAFNSVDFDVMLAILHSLNVSPSVSGWFKSYLHGRQQRISTDEFSSDWTDLTAGVPQGGVLSPLLFSIFINEISKVISSHYHLYADDLQLYRHATISNLATAVDAVNCDLAQIKEWADSFGLLVNPSKSQALIVGSSRMRNKANLKGLPSIIYNGTSIPLTDKAKNLGLIFNSNFSWSGHINDVSRRLHFSLHSLRRLQFFLPFKTKIMLAQSLLLPLIDYADVCYLDATEELLDKLERLQNLCIRFIFGLRKFDHISQFRRQLKWLPIRFRRNVHILTMLFKILKSSSPPYLHERFQVALPRARPMRSCVAQKALEVPSHNTIFYTKSFTVLAARLWNALPEHIFRGNPSLNLFKSRLKEHYLSIQDI